MIKKYQSLVDKLQNATADRKISWEPTSKGDEFKVNFGNSAVSVSRYETFPDGIFGGNLTAKLLAKLTLWDKDGNKIDEIITSKDEQISDYTSISNLYDTIRRSYYHVDEAIDDILNRL